MLRRRSNILFMKEFVRESNAFLLLFFGVIYFCGVNCVANNIYRSCVDLMFYCHIPHLWSKGLYR